MNWAYKTIGATAMLACCWLTAAAQQGTPHVGYVYPAGGRQGTSFEVITGGQFLNGVNGTLITGDGVRASVVEYIKPIDPGQAGKLRDRLKELNEKWRTVNDPSKPAAADESAKQWPDADKQEAREIRMKLAQFLRRATNAAIAEKVRLKVSISTDAAGGQHELRLVTPNGVTNPLNFYVGRLPEWSKTPAGTVTEDDVNELGNLRKQIDRPAPAAVVDVTTPLTINGLLAAGGVDRYRFKAHKGEHLVVVASARELIPYIADAVPGWFQASLTLYDASNKELEYADHYSFHPDPALRYEIPVNGEYMLAIHDSIYRGREDFVYRVALGEIPFVTGMFPLGGKVGTKTAVEFTGWNLKQTRLTEGSREKERGMDLLSLGEEEFNARPFALDTLPETMAKEQIHARGNAQKIALPVIVNGRVAHSGEWEYFKFKGKADEEIEAEVYARRLDSPLDSVLALMDADGKVLAENDDFVDESAGLVTDQADSLLRFKLPAKGVYYLRLGDSQRNGGPEFSYRLRVGPPAPDFELRIAPSSLNARAGTIVPISVYALRSGGFTGDIVVKLKDAPRGFQLSGGVVPGNQTQVRMTLSVPEGGSNQINQLALEGFATVNGKALKRTSVPADDRMQAFFYHHLVTTKAMLVTVNGHQRKQVEWAAHVDHPLVLLEGRSVAVKLALPPALAGRVQFALSDPPDGITLEKTEPHEDGVVLYLKANGVKAGVRGNLIVTAAIERPAGQGKGKGTSQMELLPAFPFEILEDAPKPSFGGESASLPQRKL